MKLHPLCEHFPSMSEDEYFVLKTDIEAHGLIEPIVMLDGMVLDGRHRMRACSELGIEPVTIEFDGEYPAAFVYSRNFARRHLTKAQQAALLALLQDWAQANTHGSWSRVNAPESTPDSQGAILHLGGVKDRAAAAGVSERTQKKADKVAKKAPDLARQVAAGEMSLDAAVAKVEGKPAAQEESPFTDDDIAADLEELRQRNVVLEQQVAAISAEDPAAETLKYVRLYDHARAEKDAAVERVGQANKARDFYVGQLRRCGKAVGEKDLDKIAAAVEAMARAKKAA